MWTRKTDTSINPRLSLYKLSGLTPWGFFKVKRKASESHDHLLIYKDYYRTACSCWTSHLGLHGMTLYLQISPYQGKRKLLSIHDYFLTNDSIFPWSNFIILVIVILSFCKLKFAQELHAHLWIIFVYFFNNTKKKNFPFKKHYTQV